MLASISVVNRHWSWALSGIEKQHSV